MMMPHRRSRGSAPWRDARNYASGGADTHARAHQPSDAFTDMAPGVAIGKEPHPLSEESVTRALLARSTMIAEAFAGIEPALEALAARQFQAGFADFARNELNARLGIKLPASAFAASWSVPFDARALHARCVLATFRKFVDGNGHRAELATSDGEPAAELIRRWGFHAIDVSPCADGRLAGLLDHILRVPPAIVADRRSYAGAMFDVAESLRQWETVELSRWRNGTPNAPDQPTRYLKIGVYHFSSLDPQHEGCAAHGSDNRRAASALQKRLDQFAKAVANTHGAGDTVATLLVGVDTDTDAIRVHVPDADGETSIDRFVDSAKQLVATHSLAREEAKESIRRAVAECAGVAVDDADSEGIRWFCGYLVKNNIAQVDAVRRTHGGAYPDQGHTERLIVVGDSVDEVQLRNLAFQAQMGTIEEGASDLDIGVKILAKVYKPDSLAVPILVHVRFDDRIPGSKHRAKERAARMANAIRRRYRRRHKPPKVSVETLIRPAEPIGLHSTAFGARTDLNHWHGQERLQ